jgi:hypothetical protein
MVLTFVSGEGWSVDDCVKRVAPDERWSTLKDRGFVKRYHHVPTWVYDALGDCDYQRDKRNWLVKIELETLVYHLNFPGKCR